MIFILIGLLIMIITAIVIKLKDDEIRQEQYRKQIVILSMFTGMAMFISGIVVSIIEMIK